jgi:hypothetical protein
MRSAVSLQAPQVFASSFSMQAREEVPEGFELAGLAVDDDRSECLCVGHFVLFMFVSQ